MPKSTYPFDLQQIWLGVYSWLRALIDNDKQTNKTKGIIHHTSTQPMRMLILLLWSIHQRSFFFSPPERLQGNMMILAGLREGNTCQNFRELREKKWEGVFNQTHGSTHAEHLKEQDTLSSVFGLMKTNNLDIYYSDGALPCIF